MSAPTTSRVDATTPVLAHLVDTATKGFTGALEVSRQDSTGRDLRVVVWLREGGIYAVHAVGWTAPDAAYVLNRTGEDNFSGQAESPFSLACQTEREGRPLLEASELDARRRDWAYGLLASSLTWSEPKVKVNRTRKVVAKSSQIQKSPWARVGSTSSPLS